MSAELGPEAVRWEGDRPVAVGGQELGQPTSIAQTRGGFWALHQVGDDVVVVHPAGAIRGRPEEVDASLRAIADDDGRDGADREVAASFLPFLGADDPGPGIARRRHGRGFSYTTPAFDLSA